MREQPVDPVGAVDKAHRALAPHHRQRKAHPVAEIGLALDRRHGFRRVGRRRAAPVLDKGRVRHDVVEAAGAEARRRLQQVADHRRQTLAHAVERRIVAGQPNKVALQFEADDAALRHPRGEAQRRRAGTAADIENQMVGLGGNRGGEKNRIDRDPRAV